MRDEGVRLAAVSGSFYPHTPGQVTEFLDRARALPLPPLEPGPLYGGVVPHAGWVYSGATATKVWRLLAERAPETDTLVLFGAVHRIRLAEGPCADWHSSWRTPLGDLLVDRVGLEYLVERGLVAEAPNAHVGEHSLEVQMPLVQAFFPAVPILPLSLVPVPGAPLMGAAIVRALRELGRHPLPVASTDLTHYGERFGVTPAGTGPEGMTWAVENDRRFLDLVERMAGDELVAEAGARANACGAGATAAALGAAAELGATRGVVVEHTDSRAAAQDPFGDACIYVGYGGVVFS